MRTRSRMVEKPANPCNAMQSGWTRSFKPPRTRTRVLRTRSLAILDCETPLPRRPYATCRMLWSMANALAVSSILIVSQKFIRFGKPVSISMAPGKKPRKRIKWRLFGTHFPIWRHEYNCSSNRIRVGSNRSSGCRVSFGGLYLGARVRTSGHARRVQ